jgi:serine protease AprX
MYTKRAVKIIIIIFITFLFNTFDFNESTIKPTANSITSEGLSVTQYLGLNKKGYNEYSGHNVHVAIVDSGISLRNTINPKRILLFKDFISKKDIPYDDYGHGTFVAGIIGANGKMQGIAPNVDFVVLKALDETGQTDENTLIKAITWILNNYNRYKIKIVNLSIGVAPYLNYTEDPLCKLINKVNQKGIIVICSAGNIVGNSGTKVLSPGISPYVITVGSCKNNRTYNLSDDKIANFSARGTLTGGYNKPNLVTLGVDILSLDYQQNGSFIAQSGTSFSCAIVSGVCALLCEKYSKKSSLFIKKTLLNSTIKLDDNKLDQGRGELYFH